MTEPPRVHGQRIQVIAEDGETPEEVAETILAATNLLIDMYRIWGRPLECPVHRARKKPKPTTICVVCLLTERRPLMSIDEIAVEEEPVA